MFKKYNKYKQAFMLIMLSIEEVNTANTNVKPILGPIITLQSSSLIFGIRPTDGFLSNHLIVLIKDKLIKLEISLKNTILKPDKKKIKN